MRKVRPVQKKSRQANRKLRRSSAEAQIRNSAGGPFAPGVIVLATLNNPREKFWGIILALDPAGLSLRGVELSSFEDSTNMVVAGDTFTAPVLFFPMHRVERVELDLPEGNIPSLSQRFTARTGLNPVEMLKEMPLASQGGGA